MKKTLALVFVAVMALTACRPTMTVQTSEGVKIPSFNEVAQEVCYKGVLYVKLDSGNSSWGSTQFGTDGKVMQCSAPENHTPVEEVCYKGVVYVKLDSGNSSWGSARYDKDSNIVLCGMAVKKKENTNSDHHVQLVKGTNVAVIVKNSAAAK